ncbi:hypothetical protein INT43_000815 [Umbelopsis isabellina]|uniref:Protein kinase domain-containing protein n=1 Tax=Mortierella isabellina TaxID=91625 RepID=A0A8H7Q2F9_MORIS|nr:hypothetical protein INT43_000815 [Umbelopsis isabellina]
MSEISNQEQQGEYPSEDDNVGFNNYFAPLSKTYSENQLLQQKRYRSMMSAQKQDHEPPLRVSIQEPNKNPGSPNSNPYTPSTATPSSTHTYQNYPTRLSSSFSNTQQPTYDQYGRLIMSQTNEVIDHSRSHDAEKVVEVSPNERFARLNALLGKGAYKVVYKAIDREEGYEVAWNTIQAMPSLENQDLEHEIEILKSVRHPNIIAFHDAWYSNNEFVFVTELMTSGTLREYIRKLSLPNIKIVKRWSRQILKGLAYLHGHEPAIIHRDIKCDNIFINGAHGEVKIGDLGSADANAVERSTFMSTAKRYTVIGTPEFMAPEMYEEQGYNEKVDIYAFGMCLLEMATGEYPYGECRNAAQIYKKVTAGIKPECLKRIQKSEVLGVIDNCLGPEEERFVTSMISEIVDLVDYLTTLSTCRMSAQEILEHSFLAVEPDVVLLAADPTHVNLTLQVVFKGMDKLSVKFEFNAETDTAEEVVREMIDEQVLPDRYQHHITKEINRILRDLDKPSESEQADQVRRSVWRRESDIRSELEDARHDLEIASDHLHEIEKRCETLEIQALQSESKYREAMKQLREHGIALQGPQPNHIGRAGSVASSAVQSDAEELHSQASAHSPPGSPLHQPIAQIASGHLTAELSQVTPELIPKAQTISPSEQDSEKDSGALREALVSRILEEYSDDTTIDVFVRDCAVATHRNMDKALEWIKKLQNQDIMTVGDLRDLHDEDWAGIGLTVFALRALKNMLKGKKLAGQSVLPLNQAVASHNSSAPSSAGVGSP